MHTNCIVLCVCMGGIEKAKFENLKTQCNLRGCQRALLGACRLLLLARTHTLDHSLRTIDFELGPRGKPVINQNF